MSNNGDASVPPPILNSDTRLTRLNSQAEVMKRSVAELLQLVGGRSESVVRPPAAANRRSAPEQACAPAVKRMAPPSHNGNGHGQGQTHTTPQPVATAQRRNEILLEGGFKEF